MCSEVIFPLTRDFQSVFQRDPQRFIQISDVTKKHSNAHSSLVDYCSRVTEHGVMKIPFSLQLTSISLTSDANLKPVY